MSEVLPEKEATKKVTRHAIIMWGRLMLQSNSQKNN